MSNKKRNNIEIEHPYIKEIDHETLHPQTDHESLRNVDFAPGENSYLSELAVNE